MKHHPDKGGATNVSQVINKAYETLNDELAREIYDNSRHKGAMSFLVTHLEQELIKRMRAEMEQELIRFMEKTFMEKS